MSILCVFWWSSSAASVKCWFLLLLLCCRPCVLCYARCPPYLTAKWKVSYFFIEHLKIITQVCSEMEKSFACVIVYTLTKCFGIISVQQICKHCQRVWIGTENLGSNTLITVNWWTDMLALLWKHAWADTLNMSAVMNDSEMQSFIVAVFPECTSLLTVKPVAREDFGNSYTAVLNTLCLVTHSTPIDGAFKKIMSS